MGEFRVIWKKTFAVFLGALLLAGCNAYGPTKEPNYQVESSAALPTGAGTVEMSGPGLWAPNANGFAGLMQQPPPLTGSLLVTSNGVYFQQWLKAENRYDTMGAVKYSDIDSVRREDFGRNVRVVIKKRDLSVVSLSFMDKQRQLVDLTKTDDAYARISAHVQP
jgi:hypothetical protein